MRSTSPTPCSDPAEKGLPLGLYLDVKADYAPDDRNAYTSDFRVTIL